MRAELLLSLLLLPSAAAAQSFFHSSSCSLVRAEGKGYRLVKEGQDPVEVELKNEPMVHYTSDQCGLAVLSGILAGSRLIFNTVDIYSSTGAFIASNRVYMEDSGGAGMDSEGKLFLYAYQAHGRGGADLFSMETGERLWNLRFPGEAAEVKLSDDGERVLALIEKPGKGKTRNYRLSMYSAEGKELWRDDFSSLYSAGFESYDADLRRFEVWLRYIRLGVEDGMKLKQKRKYSWDGTRLVKKITDHSSDEHKPVEKKKRTEDHQHNAGGDLDLPDPAAETGKQGEHGHRQPGRGQEGQGQSQGVDEE